ncbi:hypothetical protein K443DRAFT_126650 [Laccaria amethystina LaAM-08-1]|uniref:Uncharacterized protein n=1 Tax=Laccaria amethystina LaAM-08-1 TaxID=1095629 RepID=A0A0C9WGQ3_9AGAR|nr:hypothetical protein K443DRAFT_126650 [Laccaria amethystina LaAM-08-1]
MAACQGRHAWMVAMMYGATFQVMNIILCRRLYSFFETTNLEVNGGNGQKEEQRKCLVPMCYPRTKTHSGPCMGQLHQKDEAFKENASRHQQDCQTRRTRAITWQRKSRNSRQTHPVNQPIRHYFDGLNLKGTLKILLEGIEDEQHY